MRHDSIYAVLGAAGSRDVVTAPTDKYDARSMRSDAKASGTSFFCSLAVGGCGSKLKLAAGDVRIPYFSHAPQAVCALTDTAARDGYTHLAIQRELRQWVLGSTSLLCELEVTTLDRKGRSDLVIRDAEDRNRLGLEIQLSPLTHMEMRRRSLIYLKGVNKVQWLYGYEDNQACWGEVEKSGYALRVHIDMQTLACDLGYFGFHGAHNVGSFQTTWRPLKDWTVRPDGLFSPIIKAVLEEVRAKAERVHASRPAPKPSMPEPPMPAYEYLYSSLSQHFETHLFKDNAVIRKRVIEAIYRKTVKGQMDEDMAEKLLQWLAEHTLSYWWRNLLGSRSKDAEIVVHVLDAYASDAKRVSPGSRG
ncbi:hypothetical protein GCM10009825_01110 [Arthrobacter humicola]|uniref:Competence protein CoiA nuclease-like domain-containing protein n=1 Tax=Arthrobacter humicola TaxID=409291 RepID=A0ABN2YF41_9MICC